MELKKKVTISQNDSAEMTEILKESLLFQGAENSVLEFVASKLEVVSFRSGDPIFLENEISDHVYFVKSGRVEIASFHTESKQINRLAIIGPGGHFAEFSVLNHDNKSASAFALEESELLRLDSKSFLEILLRFPLVSKQLSIILSKLVFQFVETHNYISYFNADDIKYNKDILLYLPISLWERYQVLPISLDGRILRLGMINPHNVEFFRQLNVRNSNLQIDVYLIAEHEFKIQLDSLVKFYKNNNGIKGRHKYSHPEDDQHQNTLEYLIESNIYFSQLHSNIQGRITSLFTQEEYKVGDIIISKGDKVDKYFLIKKGRVEISKLQKDEGVFAKVGELNPKDGFGEVSILSNNLSILMVTAVTDITIYSIEKRYFLELMNRPRFSVAVSKILAKYLKKDNQIAGVKNFDSEQNLDFDELTDLIPLSIVQEKKILPLILKDNELILGVLNSDSQNLYHIVGRYLLDFRVSIVQISEQNYSKWLLLYLKTMEENSGENLVSISKAKDQKVKVNPVVELEKIILDGVQMGASDVHLEPVGDFLCMRYRVDGVLKERDKKISFKLGGSEIINRLKVVSDLDITNHMVPQDGQLAMTISGCKISARVSTLPTKKGEKAVLRLVPERNSVVPLNVLAPDRRVVNILRNVTRCRQGLFLVTGPTGSGKTTSLYSLLNEVNRIDSNVITLENPVELEIPGLVQVEVNEKQGLTFKSALRSVLRQDPDIIMVGEIRDAESAKIVFEAAITGHLVLSTLHSSSSLDVGPRLKELGIEPGTMASGLLGVMAQRLVRKVCEHCKSDYKVTNEELTYIHQVLGHQVQIPTILKKGAGCSHCKGSGFAGRLPIYEIWRKTNQVESVLQKGSSNIEMMNAVRQDNYNTLLESGVKMALYGLTTISEVRRTLAQI
ncbi:MAG: Flp pilus assembly complex ATPase component TadA [Bdellovibrionales bacterium]|nr:Flp pilus assembly complex ATPase component TadA [Bdellovibrionales bacterium]